ncbi:MAG TPA: RNase H family protein [Acidimicrobiales bacterium]
MTTDVYTDGACSGNPGPGGWAWAVPGGAFAAGAEAHTTNQRMEISAAFEAVKTVEGPLEIVSDSTYVVNCFRDRWHEGWVKRGWLNSQKKPVANRDLWEPFVELVRARGDVTFRWVKGHAGDPMNDLVDRLAVEAATTQKGRSGDGPPDELGPPDSFGTETGTLSTETTSAIRAAVVAASTADGRPYAGHALLVVGHRPPVVDPDGDPEAVGALLDSLIGELLTVEKAHPDLVVVTGLRQGAEQLAAEAAVGAGLPYVAVLPWPDPASGWSDEARERFLELAEEADQVVLLQDEVPDSRQGQVAAMARRDDWLARHVDAALVVWDGVDDAVGRFQRSVLDHLGPEAVTVVPPT